MFRVRGKDPVEALDGLILLSQKEPCKALLIARTAMARIQGQCPIKTQERLQLRLSAIAREAQGAPRQTSVVPGSGKGRIDHDRPVVAVNRPRVMAQG